MAIIHKESLQTNIAVLQNEACRMGAAAVGKKVYLFGGSSGAAVYDTIQIFDTETNAISTLATKLPLKMYDMGTVAIGTKVYLFGGYGEEGFEDKIQVFDTETNAISTLATKLPDYTSAIATAAIGTKIYLFGGGSGGTVLNTIQVFDTEINTLSTLATKLPVSAYNMGAAAVGKKVYLFGGKDQSFSETDTIQVFDAEINTTSTLATKLPINMTLIATAAIGTKIYLFGGTAGKTVYDTIQIFDTETNAISTSATKLPTTLLGVGSAVVGTRVYLFGGSNGIRTDYNTIHCYAPEGTLADAEESYIATVITYNGSTIASLEAGQTATVKTAGCEVEHDIVVKAGEQKEAVLQEKTVTENGEFTPDEGYDGLSKVTVNVPIPDGYIQPNGTLTVTENGTHNVAAFASVLVNVPVETVEEWDGTVIISGGLISFTIGSVTYQAEEGMTWGEWCESDYNTGGWFVTTFGLIVNDTYTLQDDNFANVYDTLNIIPDYHYYASSTGGSN